MAGGPQDRAARQRRSSPQRAHAGRSRPRRAPRSKGSKRPTEDSIERARAWLAAGTATPLDRLRYGRAIHRCSRALRMRRSRSGWKAHGPICSSALSSPWSAAATRRPAAARRPNGSHATSAHAALTITSGLAIGIDGASHRGALQGAAGTIAVLGGGLDVLFPRAHAALAAAIAERRRARLRVFARHRAAASHFPQRNRIIAGLALGTLVVEATRRSGSLITARVRYDLRPRSLRDPGLDPQPARTRLPRSDSARREARRRSGDVLLELAPQLPAALLAKAQPVESGAAPAVEQRRPCVSQALDALEFAPLPIGTTCGARRIDGGGGFLHAPDARATRVRRGVARRSVFASAKRN